MSSNAQGKRPNTSSSGNPRAAGGKPKQSGDRGGHAGPAPGSQRQAPPGAKKASPQSQRNAAPDSTVIENPSQSDKLKFILTALIGQNVVVTLKDGTQWEGLFHTANPIEPNTPSGWGIVLRMAKVIATATEPNKDTLLSRPVEVVTINDSDFVNITAKRISTDPQGPPRSAVMNKFLTDTEISTKQGIQERELQSWLDTSENSHLMGSLEDDTTELGWDQFEVNKRKFNVKTTYREELYTTELDRNDPSFRQREAEARRLAREIERETTTNVHLAEERGQKMEEDGLDEEDRYSSVIRDQQGPPAQRNRPVNYAAAAAVHPPPPTGGASKYVVPARRSDSPNGSSSPEQVPEEAPSSPTLSSVDASKRRSSRGMSGSFKVEPALVQARQQQIVSAPSPTTSPIMGRATSPAVKGLAPLQLDSSSPKLSERAARDFVDFDREYTAQESQRTREARTKELKKFSEELETKKIGSPTLKPTNPPPPTEKPPTPGEPKIKLNPFAKEFKPGSSILAAITPVDGKKVQSTGPQLGPVVQQPSATSPYGAPAPGGMYIAAPPPAQMGYYGGPVSVVPAGVAPPYGPPGVQPSIFLERPPFIDTRTSVTSLYSNRMRNKLRNRSATAAASSTPASPASGASSGGSETWNDTGAGKRRQSYRDKEPAFASSSGPQGQPTSAPVMIGSPTLVAMSAPVGIPGGQPSQGGYYYQTAPYGYVEYGYPAMSPPTQPGSMYAAYGGYPAQGYSSSPPQHMRGNPGTSPKHSGYGGYSGGYPQR